MIIIKTPELPFSNQSFQVTKSKGSPYSNWSKQERTNAFFSFLKIINIWKKLEIADQYLVYGVESATKTKAFNWEIIPFSKSHSLIDRIWKQTALLWSISFGGSNLSQAEYAAQQKLKAMIDSSPPFNNIEQENSISADPFCNPKVIEKQIVLDSKLINILYSYAPIGFGGERLHFLIMPKAHKEKFSSLSKEEYLEATNISQKLIAHFSKTRNVQNSHLLHKTGKDAGQTIDHWHLHLILTTNPSQDWIGKFTILKNMLIGSFPLGDKELKERVQSYKNELAYLNPGKIS